MFVEISAEKDIFDKDELMTDKELNLESQTGLGVVAGETDGEQLMSYKPEPRLSTSTVSQFVPPV
ncbi:hypothetical protein J6590_010613 [Homalodisca vitripennis]|nr:hypothetical protein J6590_010613 [Homalodisca vitripennis]